MDGVSAGLAGRAFDDQPARGKGGPAKDQLRAALPSGQVPVVASGLPTQGQGAPCSATATTSPPPGGRGYRPFGAVAGSVRGLSMPSPAENYKIVRDCGQHGNGLHHSVQAVAHMHNLALAV